MSQAQQRPEPDERDGVAGHVGVPHAAPPSWLWPSLLIITAVGAILLVVIWTTRPEERAPEPAATPELTPAHGD